MVPAYNEALNLESSITRLRRYLDESFPFRTMVTIVDNGSTDGTALIAQRLAATIGGVQALLLSRKGRGYALRTAWSASESEVVAYMDVDLSTSLTALLPLVGSVLSGHSDLAVGTRLARGVPGGPRTQARTDLAGVQPHRAPLAAQSRLRLSMWLQGHSPRAALQILPLVGDDEWFFDTELIIAAERLGVRISETPVDWTDDPNSSVAIVHTALDDLRGIWRIARFREFEHSRTRDLTPGPPGRVRPRRISCSPLPGSAC